MPVEWGSFQQNNYGRMSATKPFLKRLAGRRGPALLGGQESRSIVIGIEHESVIEFIEQNLPMRLRAFLGGLPLLDPMKELIFARGIPSHRFSWRLMVLLYNILKFLIEKKSDDVSMPVEWVWIIPTEFGDVVRSRADLREGGKSGTVPFNVYIKDLPDSRKSKTEVSNVCGFVAGFSSLFEQHPAWHNVRSTQGRFLEAYSLKGGRCARPRIWNFQLTWAFKLPSLWTDECDKAIPQTPCRQKRTCWKGWSGQPG